MILVLLLGSLSYAWAQRPIERFKNLKEKREEIEKAKKEFITARINLSEEQEADFWPIYDDYIQQKIRLKTQTNRFKRQNFSMAATDEQLEEAVDQMFTFREEELKLDKEMKEKLLGVINIRQLAELYRSEQEFVAMLVKILREK